MKKIISMLLVVGMICCLSGCIISFEPYYETEGHTLTFVESKDVVMYEQTYVGLFFDYTNESGETAVPCEHINVKAFQNGIELQVSVFVGERTEGAIQCDTQVQTGTTARVVWLFTKDDDSPISVETTDGQKFTVE